MKYFHRWRKDLDKLTKRVGPKGFELVKEVQAMGPEKGISFIEGLLGASPAQLKRYATDVRGANDAVKVAAKVDMNAQLNEWRKHGKNIF